MSTNQPGGGGPWGPGGAGGPWAGQSPPGQQPAQPAPQPGAYQPQPGAYQPQPGAYQPQPGAYQPQPGAYQPQPGAYPQPGGYQQGAQPFQQAGSMPGSVENIGVFGKVPCPTCGAPTSSHATGARAGQYVGGLVGWLVVRAFMGAYYCPSHGKIPLSALPPQHRNMVYLRKGLTIGGAFALFIFVIVLVFVMSALGHY